MIPLASKKVGGSPPDSDRSMWLRKKAPPVADKSDRSRDSSASKSQQSPQASPRSSRSSSLSSHSSPELAQTPERKAEESKDEGPDQPEEPLSQNPVIAYYLFERESQRDGVTRLAFVDGDTSDRVYVIDKERVLSSESERESSVLGPLSRARHSR